MDKPFLKYREKMMDIKNLIQKKRLPKREKIELAQWVITQSTTLVMKKGKFVKISNLQTKPRECTHGQLEIMLTTPFNKIPGVDYLLDIWCSSYGKVFSAHWKDHSDIDIVNFRRGVWILKLLTTEIEGGETYE